MATRQNLLDEIRWNDQGLVPVITQDSDSGQVLMLAWMNREALQKTLDSGEAVYWSRSRSELWHKGEQSGNIQRVQEVRLDCDGDTLLLKIEQVGGIACHTGRASCLFRRYDEAKGWEEAEPVIRDPEEIYGA